MRLLLVVSKWHTRTCSDSDAYCLWLDVYMCRSPTIDSDTQIIQSEAEVSGRASAQLGHVELLDELCQTRNKNKRH